MTPRECWSPPNSCECRVPLAQHHTEVQGSEISAFHFFDEERSVLGREVLMCIRSAGLICVVASSKELEGLGDLEALLSFMIYRVCLRGLSFFQ